MSQYANVRQVILKQKRAAKSPLLKKFLGTCIKEAKQNFLSTQELYDEYCNVVALWTDNDSVDGQTSYLMKRNSFNRQFMKAILTFSKEKHWDVKRKTNHGSIRGYQGIELQRARRQPPGFEFGGRLMLEKINNFMSLNPLPVPPIELHTVPSDPRGAGICAFASRDVMRGEVVAEYEGAIITSEEAKTRESQYKKEKKACTLMVIENAGRQVAIDPYEATSDGNLTWAATINHSRRHANLKPFVANRHSSTPRVFLVAIHDIPESIEFLWNYNDPDCDFYSNSQTLP